MRLFNDGTVQVVLQRPDQSGARAGMLCECFGNVPSVSPALIAVVACGGARAYNDAVRLAATIGRELRTMSTDPQRVAAPCGTRNRGPARCRAHDEPSCRRVLIVVGDGTLPLDDSSADQFAAVERWAWEIKQGHSQFAVLPALPKAAEPRAKQLLGTLLAPFNACFWENDPAELTPAVLQTAEITVSDFRAFISYRRQDGQEIANQLFDELNRRNFDVFLDRFRVDPGANVQERITEDLIDKSMVVLVETASAQQSTWVAQEIACARANRLGILAVNIGGAPHWPGIGAWRRISVPGLNANGGLPAKDLNRVCRRIAIAHGAAMARRRQYLRQALRDALQYHGATRQTMAADGFLEAFPKAAPAAPYRVWLTPRPAEITDFQMAKLKGIPKPMVVSPGALLTGAKASGHALWLAGAAYRAVRRTRAISAPWREDMAKGRV